MDRLTSSQRSRNMQAIKSRNTQPEMRLRSALHRLGLRFRLHRKDLPGRPDIIFPRAKLAIFVHGCFWHSHGCKRGGTGPKSNSAYWQPKLRRTVERDKINRLKLIELGWRVATVWECELEELDPIAVRLGALVDRDKPLGPEAKNPTRE